MLVAYLVSAKHMRQSVSDDILEEDGSRLTHPVRNCEINEVKFVDELVHQIDRDR